MSSNAIVSIPQIEENKERQLAPEMILPYQCRKPVCLWTSASLPNKLSLFFFMWARNLCICTYV